MCGKCDPVSGVPLRLMCTIFLCVREKLQKLLKNAQQAAIASDCCSILWHVHLKGCPLQRNSNSNPWCGSVNSFHIIE